MENGDRSLLKLQIQITSLYADLQQTRAKHVTDDVLSKGVMTALALQKTTCQEVSSTYVKESEKRIADKPANDMGPLYYRTDVFSKLGQI